ILFCGCVHEKLRSMVNKNDGGSEGGLGRTKRSILIGAFQSSCPIPSSSTTSVIHNIFYFAAAFTKKLRSMVNKNDGGSEGGLGRTKRSILIGAFQSSCPIPSSSTTSVIHKTLSLPHRSLIES
uniref:Uncharacterized protein n=1 Tax=Parascaris univalens TaxID=6257 RepID=A0A914ZQ01_PARUN